MQALLAHPGTQYSFRLAAELHRQNVLLAFFTGLAFSAEGKMERLWRTLPSPYRRWLANRRIENLPAEKLKCHPVGELIALLQLRSGQDPQRVMHQRNYCFQRWIPRDLITSADAVIGFDTSAWILAERCHEAGTPLVLDQSIGHPDSKTAIFERVMKTFPGWTEGMESRRSEVRCAEQEEHEAATLVVAASSFTRQTLIEHGMPAKKIRVNPYGVDSRRFSVAEPARSRPFRFVFVGSISARKGVPLLLEAWRRLRAQKAELWLIGPASSRAFSQLPALPGLRYFGGVPHVEVPRMLQECDVFVFPSYFEGFGLVILEAMASGLPVISTTATACADIDPDGVAGWTILPGDLEKLIAAMSESMINPSATRFMGRTAREIAKGFNWEAYGQRWAQILQEVCTS